MSIELLSLVSIITPVYNRETLLRYTVESIKNQTYNDWELLLIDDGSTDNSVKIIMEYAKEDNRVKFFRRIEEPKGAQSCRNIGLKNAKGKYVIFLDSDDILAEFCLTKRVLEFESLFPEKDFLVFPGLRFKENLYDLNLLISSYKGTDVIPLFFNRDVPWVNFNPIYKRVSLIDKSLNWNDKILIYQDILFHVSCVCRGLTFAYAGEEPDCFWREHDEGSIGKLNDNSQPYIISMSNLFNALYDEMKKTAMLTSRSRLCLNNFVFEYAMKYEKKSFYFLYNIRYMIFMRKILYIIVIYFFKLFWAKKILGKYFEFKRNKYFKKKYYLTVKYIS